MYERRISASVSNQCRKNCFMRPYFLVGMVEHDKHIISLEMINIPTKKKGIPIQPYLTNQYFFEADCNAMVGMVLSHVLSQALKKCPCFWVEVLLLELVEVKRGDPWNTGNSTESFQTMPFGVAMVGSRHRSLSFLDGHPWICWKRMDKNWKKTPQPLPPSVWELRNRSRNNCRVPVSCALLPEFIKNSLRWFPVPQGCHCSCKYMDVSKNRGTPKWMVYNGKPY